MARNNGKNKVNNSVTVMLDDEDYEKFDTLCHRTGLSQSAVFRAFYKQHFDQFMENMKTGKEML